jgi:hypothetical protein
MRLWFLVVGIMEPAWVFPLQPHRVQRSSLATAAALSDFEADPLVLEPL